MIKSEYNKFIIFVGKIAPVLFTGLKYMITGTLTVGLFVVAVAGFCLVSRDVGYVAVADFLASCIALVVAVACMYFLGLPRKRKGGRYEE